jgi:hypothetical protein
MWQTDGATVDDGLIEIPVTTLPILKIPFHVSYILYLATFSRRLASAYFKTALTMCRLAGVQPSLLLHPLDFLGHEDVRELSFFPGMKLSRTVKLEMVHELIAYYSSRFRVGTLSQHAAEFRQESNIVFAEPGLGSG